MSKLPSFQFYPGDWMKDPGLRRSSHAAKGVLMDVLCLMFESSERGVLATAGKPWTDEEVCAAIGGHADVTLMSLRELLDKGVLRRRNDGAIYSVRMVRDEEERVQARRRKQNQRLTQVSRECHGDVTVNVTPPSHSSSSSSSSSYISTHSARAVPVMIGNGEEAEPDSSPDLTPTLAEVQAFATASGLGADCAEKWWNEMEGVGWVNRFGRPVRKWRPLFLSYGAAWRSNEHLRAQQGKRGMVAPAPKPPSPPKPLGEDFRAFLADHPEYAGSAEAWQTTKDLPLSAREDFSRWKMNRRRDP